ncbi:hypothetical protein EF888_09390 [Silicimonas algicola]|uniref:Transferrin-binding protein B C-lobe/N-lobe beta barrel domain-containing protein n=1 Tax=Silicimonas algicola TaxID=1826607 RepID=A0A316G7P7_9RHOB|nr:hypothetical protein [Silicimonas algicola]AZQ67319.1 hypothetical protein EF888_09390 [Silicimonas algicola]PWK56999.1 hypothetical protein C8D95_103235 [Silicimonas algicola]
MKLTALAPLAILPLIAACGSNDDYGLPGNESLYIGSGADVTAAGIAHDDAVADALTVEAVEGTTVLGELPSSGRVSYVGTIEGVGLDADYYADLGMRADLETGDVDGQIANFYWTDARGWNGVIGLDGEVSDVLTSAGVAVSGDGTLTNGTASAAYTVDIDGFLYGDDGTAFYMDGTSTAGAETFDTEAAGVRD